MPTATFRASIFSTTAATGYATTSTYTPAANSFLVALVIGCSTTVVDPDGASPFVGHGVTWTKLTLSANSISTTHAMSVWVAKAGASPSSAAATATWATNRTGAAVIEFEVTGVDVSGTSAAAIIQNPTTNGTSNNVTATNLLAAATTSTNLAMGLWCHLANEASTAGGGDWSEPAGADGNFNNPATGVQGQVASTFNRSPQASWTTSSAYRVVGLEIATALSNRRRRMMMGSV